MSIKFLAGVVMSALIVTSSVSATSVEEVQKEADKLREEGKSLMAISLYNESIVGHLKAKDYAGVIEALTGRLLSWKHLFYKTDDTLYAILVKKEAEAIQEVANFYHVSDRMHLIHFLKATAATLLKDYRNAEEEFRKSIELYPNDNAEKGDMIAHLGDAMYRNGKKEEGKKTILNGIEVMKAKSSQVDSFLLNVWISGAYLRLAKLLKADNPEESRKFLNQAEQIINSDSRLVIRKQQLESFQLQDK